MPGQFSVGKKSAQYNLVRDFELRFIAKSLIHFEKNNRIRDLNMLNMLNMLQDSF